MVVRTPIWLGMAALAAGALLWSALGGWQWGAVKARIRKEFPAVPQVGTGALAARLEGERPLLLDVRTLAEYEVSHLAGARRVEPGALPELGVPKDAPIVTYCSVGYRSSALAQRLRAAGYTRVENLEGSIFQWANEGRPLVRDGQPAKLVHPYDAVWGRLLDKERRAEMK